jgi:UDPglucose 6-dehydrogenase
MTKYANNAFLATKISFINEIANMCERFGADVKGVAHAIGLDSRISSKFLRPGIGFGGSCFPKDVKALVARAKEDGVETHLLDAVLERNSRQPLHMVEMLKKRIDIKGSRIAVLGLAFKPGTDDIREAPSLKVIDELLKIGAEVVAYDPEAMANAKLVYGGEVVFAPSLKGAVEGSDALLLVTEWDEFKGLGEHLSSMRGNIIIDGRLALDMTDFEDMDFGGVGYG